MLASVQVQDRNRTNLLSINKFPNSLKYISGKPLSAIMVSVIPDLNLECVFLQSQTQL